MITIITPLIIMLFLEYVIKMNEDFLTKDVDHPERIPLPGVKDCIVSKNFKV